MLKANFESFHAANAPRPVGPETPKVDALPRHLSRVYRAHIGPATFYGLDRTAFVEAACHRDAIRKIANAVGALEARLPETVEDRIYNVFSARELLDEGLMSSSVCSRRAGAAARPFRSSSSRCSCSPLRRG